MLNSLSLGFLPSVSFDTAYGDRDLRAAADALTKRQDWRPARDLLLASTGNWPLKDHQVQYLSDRAVGNKSLWAWAEAEPHRGDPLTVLSAAETARAWAIRGGRRARYVRRRAWPRFFEILRQADELAGRACELAPADPTPRATALRIARGLQIPRYEFDARWQALIALDPLHRGGHRHALQYLCAKWSGSHREMFLFAREAAEQAPDGHPLVMLPVLANLEMRLADEGGLGSARFHTDLARIQERWIEVGPQQHPRIAEDHSLLAFYMGLIQRRPEAAHHFRAMGRHASIDGWRYTLFARQAFLRARAAALRAG